MRSTSDESSVPTNPALGRFGVRTTEFRRAEDLRRLHRPVLRAVGRREHHAVLGELEGVDSGVADNSAGSAGIRRERSKRAVDQLRRQERTGAVLHEHGCDRVRHGGQAGRHRLLARGTTRRIDDGHCERERFDGDRAVLVDTVGVCDQHDQVDPGRCRQAP